MVRREVVIIRPVLNEYCISSRAFFEVLSYNLGTQAKKAAEKRNWKVIDLPWYSATREALAVFLRVHPDAELVVFLGHGDHRGDRAIGHGRLPIFDSSNIGCFMGKGLYFVCCHAGRVLGELAAAAGASFFVGYNDKLRLMSHKGELLTAHCTLCALTRLLAGCSAQDAVVAMEQEHLRCIKALRSEPHNHDPQLLLAGTVLELNLEGLTLWNSARVVRRGNMSQANNNPNRVMNPQERQRGMDIIRRWVADASTIPDTDTDFEGSGDSWSLKKILDSLEQDKNEETPERYLRDVVNTHPK